MIRPTSRALSAAAVLTGALALTACSGDTTAARPASSAATAFRYTDARGTAVDLDSVPKTVVAQSSVAAALWDAGYRVKGAYGELTPGRDGKLSYQAGSLDPKKIDVIGSTYGEFDIDRYALLKPDLLVDYSYDGKSLWYVPAKQADQILGLAPSIGVPGTYSSTDAAIATFVGLAGKLGADVSSSAVRSAKAAYTTAQADAEKASSTSPLKVLVISPTKDTVYVVDPAQVPELKTLKAAGLDVMTPKHAAKDVFTQVSWEQMSDYADADVILVDARSYASTLASIQDVAAWKALPAVRAGQVHEWYASAPYSYQAYTKVYDAYAADLARSKDLP